MQTETTKSSTPWRVPIETTYNPMTYLGDRRLVIVLLLALLAGTLAYQTPPRAEIAVGWLGDQLFLTGSESQREIDIINGRWLGDELNDRSESGRSRWTRQNAVVELPGIGASHDMALTIGAQGWPEDALISCGQQPQSPSCLDQPTVIVEINGIPIGQFEPSSEWAQYTLRVPALSDDTLRLRLQTSNVFTATQTYPHDLRQKGIRVNYLGLQSSDPLVMVLPASGVLALLALCAVLFYLTLTLLLRKRNLAFVLTTLAVSGAAISLALARIWMVALLPYLTWVLLLCLMLVAYRPLMQFLTRLLRLYTYGNTVNYGLITAAAAWLAYIVARASEAVQLPGFEQIRTNFADSLLLGLLGMGLLVLTLVLGRSGLPRLSHTLVRFTGSSVGGALLLALFCVLWFSYIGWVIAELPHVGHADYADNAVVARNLLEGRGWVVDYVTQFYYLNPGGVTRPQETWPLLQPVWVAPAFALFGVSNWSAKIPNLVFLFILALLIYGVGRRLWDRRVALTAVILVLTSHLFFKLVIYVTTDLAFTVFSFSAISLVYLWTLVEDRQTTNTTQQPQRWYTRRWVVVAAAGVMTGLMMLQKPSGAVIAFGMGLWLLAWAWRARTGDTRSQVSDAGRPSAGNFRRWLTKEGQAPTDQQQTAQTHVNWKLVQGRVTQIAVWTLIAMVVLSPYLARNMVVFGRPFYSTESYEAWILEYTDWEQLYTVYTTDAGLSELGIPDRSWLLRWGFDRVLHKLWVQVDAVRNYLLPPWTDQQRSLADPQANLQPLLFAVGAWLTVLGALGAVRTRRRLLTLLLMAFGPYTIFLITYWHSNEERYFVMVLPWLALLAGYAIWRGYDRIADIGDGRWTPLGLVLALTAIVLILQPSWPKIEEKVRPDSLERAAYAADADLYTWLRDNTPDGTVMMTRNPWQLNWISERPAVMIPNTNDPQLLLRIARYYNARYLVLDTINRPSRQVRDMIDVMVDPQGCVDRGVPCLQLAYATPPYIAISGTREIPNIGMVYRFPENYGEVAELQP